MLFNQFHDLAAGSGIGVIYRDAQNDYDQVHWAANEITSKSLDTVQARVNTHVPAGSVPVMVVNPLGWDRSGVVEAEVKCLPLLPKDLDSGFEGSCAAIAGCRERQEDEYVSPAVRCQGCAIAWLRGAACRARKASLLSQDLKADGLTMENATLRVTVDPQTGCIHSPL